MRPWALAASALAMSLAVAPVAHARPQANSAWTTGPCGVGEGSSVWDETLWCNGLRADLLFGRERGSDFAVGPYVQLSSAGFWDARFGGGVSLLAPIHEDFPLVLSLGAGAHELDSVALESFLFWGPRAYNFHGSYSLAGGLLVGYSRDLDSDAESTLLLGVQIDGFVLALPFIVAYEWIRGTPD